MRVRTVIFALVLVSTGVVRPAAAQEQEVRDAITGALMAWQAGDFPKFASFYHTDTRGFFLDGGMLAEGFNVATLEAAYNAGFRADLDIDDVRVQVHGPVALTTGLLQGSLTLPGGGLVEGTWRYSDARVLEDGLWKVVQYHFSEMAGPGLR